MLPSIHVKSPVTSTVSEPVKIPTSPPGVRFRVATVMVAPVLKFTAPDKIVSSLSVPTSLPGIEDDVGGTGACVLITVAPLTSYLLPEAKLADTPEPKVTEPAPLKYEPELKV